MTNEDFKVKAIRAPVTKPITEAPVEKAPVTVYERREWKGKGLWQCRKCPFNSLDERSFWMHWAQRHQPQRTMLSALVGPHGKPIEKPIETKEG